MSERDELRVRLLSLGGSISAGWRGLDVAGQFDQEKAEAVVDATMEVILAAGYRKPRVIKTAAELEALPFGSAIQTSDLEDVVVLKSEGRNFLNQSGCELSVEGLWRYGTHPFTVLYEGAQS